MLYPAELRALSGIINGWGDFGCCVEENIRMKALLLSKYRHLEIADLPNPGLPAANRVHLASPEKAAQRGIPRFSERGSWAAKYEP
jgi:hypothetical protein